MVFLRTGLGILVAVLLLPLWIALLPVFWLWARRQKRRARAAGYEALWHFMPRTLRSYCETLVSVDPPPRGWAQVARNVDRYIAGIDSPRIWRVKLLLMAMEYGPLLSFRLPFSRLSAAARRHLVETCFYRPGHPMAPLAYGRQLARLGYYADDDLARQSGFVPVEARPRHAAREMGIAP